MILLRYMEKNIHSETLRIASGWNAKEASPQPPVISRRPSTDTLTIPIPIEQAKSTRFLENMSASVGILHHDEHFDYAVKRGLIAGAILITHENFSLANHNPALEIIHNPPGESKSEKELYYSQILETDFLENALAQAKTKLTDNYILDIDLDCFKTEKSVHPDNPKLFHSLIKNARAITICLERDWVRLLNMDFNRSLDADCYYKNIIRHIKNALL